MRMCRSRCRPEADIYQSAYGASYACAYQLAKRLVNSLRYTTNFKRDELQILDLLRQRLNLRVIPFSLKVLDLFLVLPVLLVGSKRVCSVHHRKSTLSLPLFAK